MQMPSEALKIRSLPSSWMVTIFSIFYYEEMRRRGVRQKATSLSVSALREGKI